MDDIVRQALAKWPNVPDCYGWLGLDARGAWWMRDDRTQAAGPFPAARGSRLEHDKLIAFIARNYEADDRGCWFFQNGPQRVYVELEATPVVWRVDDGTAAVIGDHASRAPKLTAHTGAVAALAQTLLDEAGRLYGVSNEQMAGLIHTMDVGLAADAIERGAWPAPVEVVASTLPTRFGYQMSPQAAARP